MANVIVSCFISNFSCDWEDKFSEEIEKKKKKLRLEFKKWRNGSG